MKYEKTIFKIDFKLLVVQHEQFDINLEQYFKIDIFFLNIRNSNLIKIKNIFKSNKIKKIVTFHLQFLI